MHHDTLIVTEAELRDILTLDRSCVDIVEAAFTALARGDVVMPPILSMDLPMANAEVDVETAYIPGFHGFAIKVSPGFFDNPGLGLPSLNGLMILFSAKTGLVQALFLDNGYLTDLRTAAAGAVAARHMAPKEVKTIGVLGTGVQARMQVAAARLERKFEQVLVWGRNPENAKACAADIETALNIPATAVQDAANVVAHSQLVITTTPAKAPILQADWLHPGLHITAMGSDQEGKNELDPACLSRADCYVGDRLSQTSVLGELRSALACGFETKAEPSELGAVVSGQVSCRIRESHITIADLTGTGAQDTAIATHALAVSRAEGTGQTITTN